MGEHYRVWAQSSRPIFPNLSARPKSPPHALPATLTDGPYWSVGGRHAFTDSVFLVRSGVTAQPSSADRATKIGSR
jgi:hypothetical protein